MYIRPELNDGFAAAGIVASVVVPVITTVQSR